MTRFIRNIYLLYKDGFAQMTVGRVLWKIVIIKIVIIFAVLKLFFFPDFLRQHSPGGDKAEYVSRQLTHER